MCRPADKSRSALLARRLLILTIVLPLLIGGGAVHADNGMLTSTLGRWLDTQAVPELGRVLGQHPKFKGETIRLTSLESGKPLHHPSRLHQAVEAHLTQQLLSTSGVRIAWEEQAVACGAPQQPVYLLGIEIERDGTRNHKLNIGLIDVSESVWVSGVNFTWRGHLTATESIALTKPVTEQPKGTIDSPLAVTAAPQIADAMQQHLRCALPEGLDGPVYLADAQSPPLNRVLSQLRSRLATAPIAAITPQPDEAQWVLKLDSAAAGGRTQQLNLLLEDKANAVTQQVASIYVVGLVTPADGGTPAEYSVVAANTLLTPMYLQAAEGKGICSQAPSGHCVEVSFDLLAPSYLFVLSTRARSLNSASCDAPLRQAREGERRYRLRVTAAPGDLPDAGLYAIAVTDRAAAQQLATHIRSGPCRTDLPRQGRWLEQLDRLLGEHPDTFQWRAMHLVQTANGIQQL